MTTLSEDLATLLANAPKAAKLDCLAWLAESARHAEECRLFIKAHSPEIAGLAAENERLKMLCENLQNMAILADARAEAAESELAACRRDAERYRFLRDTEGQFWGSAYEVLGSAYVAEIVDAEIDKSMIAAIDAQGRGES